eukprot:9385948-Alexandrium_andersonii.AAC.1
MQPRTERNTAQKNSAAGKQAAAQTNSPHRNHCSPVFARQPDPDAPPRTLPRSLRGVNAHHS